MAIDGVRHEIQRPQEYFYSGYCRYHNFSIQIVIDSHDRIVLIQSGFLGHNNDSAQLEMMMPKIGIGEQLHLPAGLYFSRYLCQYPLLTPRENTA